MLDFLVDLPVAFDILYFKRLVGYILIGPVVNFMTAIFNVQVTGFYLQDFRPQDGTGEPLRVDRAGFKDKSTAPGFQVA
jgi:hypothetical protein